MNNKRVNLQKKDWIQRIWDWADKVKSLEDAMWRYKNGLDLIAAINLINSESLSSKYSEFIKVGLLG